MRDQRCSRNGHDDLVRRQDITAQLDVLRIAICEHPRRPDVFHASQEINQRRHFIRGDTVERAIRDLVGAGLIRSDGVSFGLGDWRWWRS